MHADSLLPDCLQIFSMPKELVDLRGRGRRGDCNETLQKFFIVKGTEAKEMWEWV